MVLASNIQEQGEILLQRLDHARFQNDFHPFSARARLLPVTSCVHCENCWTPACAAMPIDHCADRMGLASQQVMPKELSAEGIALVGGT